MGAKSGRNSGKGKGNGKGSQVDVADPAEDTSVVRRPISISVTGLKDALNVLQTGTPEVKNLLTHECEVIYECRVCRNMFRSLANFIAHKRVYCRNMFTGRVNVFDLRNHIVEEPIPVVEPAPPPAVTAESWRTSDQSYDSIIGPETRSGMIRPQVTSIAQKPNLGRIIDRLNQQAETKAKNRHVSTAKFYESATVSKPDTFPRVRVERSRKSRAMVYQTLMPAEEELADVEENRSIQETVREVESLVAQKAIAVLGSNGKVLPSDEAQKVLETPEPPSVQETDDSEGNLHCKLCNLTLSTRKTLRNHMNSIHATIRNHYPCPCCEATFLKTWSVHRHLIKIHRKTSEQANQLKPLIMKRMFRKATEMAHSQATSEFASDSEREDLPDDSVDDAGKKASQDDGTAKQLTQELKVVLRHVRNLSGTVKCRKCSRQFPNTTDLMQHEKTCNTAPQVSTPHQSSTLEPQLPTLSPLTSTLQSPQLVSVSYCSPMSMSQCSCSSMSVSQCSQCSTPVSQPVSVAHTHVALSLPSPTITPSQPSPSMPLSQSALSVSLSQHHRRSLSLNNLKLDKPEKRIGIQIRRDYSKPKEVKPPPPTVAPEATDVADNVTDNSIADNVASNSVADNNVADNNVASNNIAGNNVADNNVIDNNIVDKVADSNIVDNKIDDSPDDDDDDAVSVASTSSHPLRHRETLSPTMLEKMKPFINAQKKQCLTCSHKFGKMANLRRHVATHMEWHRYRCLQCDFRCFDKCGCIAHVKKAHADVPGDATDSVEFIQTDRNDEEVMVAKTPCEMGELNDSVDIPKEMNGGDTSGDTSDVLSSPCSSKSSSSVGFQVVKKQVALTQTAANKLRVATQRMRAAANKRAKKLDYTDSSKGDSDSSKSSLSSPNASEDSARDIVPNGASLPKNGTHNGQECINLATTDDASTDMSIAHGSSLANSYTDQCDSDSDTEKVQFMRPMAQFSESESDEDPVANGHDESSDDIIVKIPSGEECDSDSSSDVLPVRYLSNAPIKQTWKQRQLKSALELGTIAISDSDESDENWASLTKKQGWKKGVKRRKSADDEVYNGQSNGVEVGKQRGQVGSLKAKKWRCNSEDQDRRVGDNDDVEMPVLENMAS